MDRVDRYLRTMAKALPVAEREDIISELSEDIRSEIEDKQSELGRPLTEAEQQALLRQRENPLLVAARYRQDQRTLAFGRQLIGPALFPFYVKVLSVNLGLTFAVIATIFIAVDLSGHTVTFNDVLATCLLQLLIQLAVVTLIFSVAETQLNKYSDGWDAGPGGGLRLGLMIEKNISLGIDRPGAISRLESVCVIVAAAVALVWMTEVQSYPFLILGPAAAFLKLAPIWHRVYFPILLLIVAQIVRGAINLVRPDWAGLVDVFRVAVHSAGLVILYFLIKAGSWVAAVGPTGGRAGDYAGAVQIVNRSIYYSLLVAGVLTAVALVVRVVRLVRHPRNRAGSGTVGAPTK